MSMERKERERQAVCQRSGVPRQALESQAASWSLIDIAITLGQPPRAAAHSEAGTTAGLNPFSQNMHDAPSLPLPTSFSPASDSIARVNVVLWYVHCLAAPAG